MNIDMEPSAEQQRWMAVARQLAEDVLAPAASEIDREGRYPKEGLDALAEEGLTGLLIPEEFGGQGADLTTSLLVTEILAGACGSTAMCFQMHNAATMPLVYLATGSQIDRYIRPIAEGKQIFTYAVSEPASGSRWWYMEGWAERDGQDYLINASKSFVTGAGHATHYLVPVRANSSSDPSELTLFIVDSNSNGANIQGHWDGLGMRGNSSSPITFDNCRVQSDCILGDEGLGFENLFQYGLPAFMIGLGAVYLGIARAALDFAITYAGKRLRPDTGQLLSESELTQSKIADMKLRYDQARLIIYHTAGLVQKAYNDPRRQTVLIPDASTDWLLALGKAKVVACSAAADITAIAMKLCGGSGYSRSNPIERYFRDARAGSVMGPNDDDVKLIIAQRMLGHPLPWEVNKD